MDEKMYYCEKCNRTMTGDNFYSSNNLEKYPEGKLHQCKKCITMHVDNWNADTYKWILEEIDVPYIPEIWNNMLSKYGRDPLKVTGMTILGKYLSTMKIKQYKDFRWKDTEYLQEVANKRQEETMKRLGYSAAEIAEAIAKGTVPAVEKPPELEQIEKEDNSDPGLIIDYFNQNDTIEDLQLDLTEEDKTYLRLKWGKYYKPEEWVKLEQMYEDMMNSYDIQTAGHIDTLKLICKTSLKANQLLDIGDVEGYQKMAKVYDGLMKSGKFTAAQNKAETGEYVDSISELVMICEKDGFIPRYYIEQPNDKVDRVLQDLQDYTTNLVMEETNLGNLIENALKQIEIDKQKESLTESDNADDEEFVGEDELFAPQPEIDDEDYEEFSDYEEALQKQDDEFFAGLENYWEHDKDAS